MFITQLILCLALEFAFGMVHNISCIMPNCWPHSICIVDCHLVLRRSFVLRNEPLFICIWIRKLAKVAKNSNHVTILLYYLMHFFLASWGTVSFKMPRLMNFMWGEAKFGEVQFFVLVKPKYKCMLLRVWHTCTYHFFDYALIQFICILICSIFLLDMKLM